MIKLIKTVINNKVITQYFHSLIILTKVYAHRQHKTSFFGSAWVLIQPLMHVIIISYVFGLLLRQERQTMLFNLIAMLPFWNFLSMSLLSGSNSLLVNDHIIKKSTVSRSLFPLADILIQCQNLVFAFLAMYGTFILLYTHHLTARILLLPFIAMPLILTVMSLAIMLAHLTPYIRDIPQILTVLLNALYWTVPIIYPYDLIPADKKIFFELNPLFILFRPIQLLVTTEIPPMIIMAKALGICALSIIISYFIYKKYRRNVIFYL